MPLGICSRYRRHEATYLAVQLAEFADRRGEAVSIVSPEAETHPIGCRWDTQVSPRLLFTEWAARQKVVLWTHAPHVEQVVHARKVGCRTVIVPLWHELRMEQRAALEAADRVVVGGHSQWSYFRFAWNLRNVTTVAWDTGQPRLRKSSDAPLRTIRIGLPLFDRAVRRTEATLLHIIERTLHTFREVSFAVAYQPSAAAGFVRRRLSRLRQRFSDRLTLSHSPAYHDRPLWLAENDLTLWPMHVENTGLVPLTSILSGTPVLAFGVPPLSDWLGPAQGRLVPTPTTCNTMQLPIATPDYGALEQALWALIASPQRLRRLRTEVVDGERGRSSDFAGIMTELILR